MLQERNIVFPFLIFIHYRQQQYSHLPNERKATLTASNSTEGEFCYALRAVSPAHKLP